MPRWVHYIWLGLVLVAANEVIGQADDAEKKTDAKTHKVTSEPFKVEFSIDGVFEAQETAELVIHPQTWSSFRVMKAVEHGATVKKGEQLLWLDMQEIDDAVQDQESTVAAAQLDMKIAQAELEIDERSHPFDLKHAEIQNQTAQEDLDEYVKIERPFNVKSFDVSQKMADNYLAYVQEELKQLEKMYKADDLTEETEEIILRRARDNVEQTEFMVAHSKLFIDQSRRHLPRTDLQHRESARLAANAYEKARRTMPVSLEKTRLGLEKAKTAVEKAEERLAKLKKDRALMASIVAPSLGVAYLGQCVRGQWSGANRLNLGDSINAHQVFMTVVTPRPMIVRASVPEKDLRDYRAGLSGEVIPTAFPELKLSGKVESISPIPITPGSFDSKLSITLGAGTESLMPGMACKCKFVGYQKAQAVAVAASSVFAEDDDEDDHYVFISKADNQHEKRKVKLGRKTEKRAEILEGLKAGDVILSEKPADAK